MKDANGKLKPTKTLLTDTMRALGKIKDPIRRNELAFKLFGKSGVAMVQMLNGGADAIEELRAEARRTGHVMSEDAAKAAAEFGDNMDRLQKRVDGLRLLIGVHLLPAVNRIVERITAWYDANSDLIRSKISEWVARLSRFVEDLLDPTSELRGEIRGLTEWFGKLADRISPVVDFLGGPLPAALALVSAWILGPIAMALASLTAAFVRLGIVMLTTPIGWILVGIVALAAAAYVLYQRWDDFTAYWEGSWGRIKGAFDGTWGGIGTALAEFSPLTHIARGIDAVIKYFTGVSLIAEGRKLIGTLTAGLGEKIENATKAGKDAVDAVLAGAKSVAFDLDTWIRPKLTAAINEVEAVTTRWYAAGERIVGALWDGLKSKWELVRKWLADSVKALVGWLPESVQTRLGFTKDESPAGKLGERMGDMVMPPAAPTVDAPTVRRVNIEPPPLAPSARAAPVICSPCHSSCRSCHPRCSTPPLMRR